MGALRVDCLKVSDRWRSKSFTSSKASTTWVRSVAESARTLGYAGRLYRSAAALPDRRSSAPPRAAPASAPAGLGSPPGGVVLRAWSPSWFGGGHLRGEDQRRCTENRPTCAPGRYRRAARTVNGPPRPAWLHRAAL